MQFRSRATLSCDVRYAPFATHTRKERIGNQPTDAERAAANTLEQALTPVVHLDRFPKSVIEVYVLVLEADGGEVCAAINAASLALIDAGIDMRDMLAAANVAACPVAAVASSRTARAAEGVAASSSGRQEPASPALLVDPTAAEASSSSWQSTVALMPRLKLISFAYHSGEAAANAFADTLALAMDACVTVMDAMRASLVHSASQKLSVNVRGDATATASQLAPATATAAVPVH